MRADGFEGAKKAASDVALQAALDLAGCLAFAGAASGVGARGGVVLETGEDAVLGAPAALRLSDGSARRALRAPITHSDQPLVSDVRADPPARAVDPLVDLHRKRIHQRPRTHRHRQPTAGLIPGAHP